MIANKTCTERELACGCVERIWLFGREIVQQCAEHRWGPNPRPVVRSWSLSDKGVPRK